MINIQSFPDGDAKLNGRTVTCHMSNFATTIGVDNSKDRSQNKEKGNQKQHPAFRSGVWRMYTHLQLYSLKLYTEPEFSNNKTILLMLHETADVRKTKEVQLQLQLQFKP